MPPPRLWPAFVGHDDVGVPIESNRVKGGLCSTLARVRTGQNISGHERSQGSPDSGRLKGYRIPGSQDRRIPREYLIKFLKEHGMPLGDLEDEAMAKVLLVGQDQLLIENLKKQLPVERSFKIQVAASGFEAGIQAESFHPDCIVVDYSIGRIDAQQICQNLRRNPEYADTIVIALLPDDGSQITVDRAHVNESFKKPFDVALLAERLRTLIGARKELV